VDEIPATIARYPRSGFTAVGIATSATEANLFEVTDFSRAVENFVVYATKKANRPLLATRVGCKFGLRTTTREKPAANE